jgi:uncharacterized membrane protein
LILIFKKKEDNIMTKVRRSIIVNAPIEEVYNYLADQKNQPDWIPSTVEVWDVGEPKVGESYKWKYKMAGVLIEGETTVTELVPNKRIGTQTKGAVASDWLIVLEAKDGGTEVELNIDYTIPIPVLGKVAERIVLKRNEREADLAMDNIKTIIED